MAYQKLEKKDGDIFFAADIEHIEEGLLANENIVKSYDRKIGSVIDQGNTLSVDVDTLKVDVENLQADKVDKSKLMSLLLDVLYPIGSIYFNISNENPGAKLGGKWRAYGDGNSYLRLGGNGVGGSNSVLLTSDNLPTHDVSEVNASHTHPIPAQSKSFSIKKTFNAGPVASGTGEGALLVGAGNSLRELTWDASFTLDATNTSSGNAKHKHSFTNTKQTSINITPKYVQVFAWERYE